MMQCSISASTLFILTTQGKCQARGLSSCHDSSKPPACFHENQPVQRFFFSLNKLKYKTKSQQNSLCTMHPDTKQITLKLRAGQECMLLGAGNATEISYLYIVVL